MFLFFFVMFLVKHIIMIRIFKKYYQYFKLLSYDEQAIILTLCLFTTLGCIFGLINLYR